MAQPPKGFNAQGERIPEYDLTGNSAFGNVTDPMLAANAIPTPQVGPTAFAANQIPTTPGVPTATKLDPMSPAGIEERKVKALEQQAANATPTAMDTVATGLGAANTAFGIYDQLWGQGAEHRGLQMDALKQNIAVSKQEAGAKNKFRNDVATAFA